jgi:hypothetical protein
MFSRVCALQAAGAFDVQWCRGTISERIFDPWEKLLQSTGRVNIQGISQGDVRSNKIR